MRFEIKTTLIAFHDSKPGEHAMMFCLGKRLEFRNDLSVFDDARRIYSWVFEGPIKEGDEIVFATKDREITGIVRGRNIEVMDTKISMLRTPTGKPIGASQRALLRPTALTLAAAKKLL